MTKHVRQRTSRTTQDWKWIRTNSSGIDQRKSTTEKIKFVLGKGAYPDIYSPKVIVATVRSPNSTQYLVIVENHLNTLLNIWSLLSKISTPHPNSGYSGHFLCLKKYILLTITFLTLLRRSLPEKRVQGTLTPWNDSFYSLRPFQSTFPFYTGHHFVFGQTCTFMAWTLLFDNLTVWYLTCKFGQEQNGDLS